MMIRGGGWLHATVCKPGRWHADFYVPSHGTVKSVITHAHVSARDGCQPRLPTHEVMYTWHTFENSAATSSCWRHGGLAASCTLHTDIPIPRRKIRIDSIVKNAPSTARHFGTRFRKADVKAVILRPGSLCGSKCGRHSVRLSNRV